LGRGREQGINKKVKDKIRMDIHQYRTIYFLGIGGIGMSALARYFHRFGMIVSGYDRTPTNLTRLLIEEGIPVHFDEDPKFVPEHPDLVIYTPALPKDNKELQFVIDKGFPLKKRSEVLGMITLGAKTIAVAGTHGKTTITTLIAHLLKSAGEDCIAFLGGISKNYHTNLVTPDTSSHSFKGMPSYYIVEADEFDRSFLQLYPSIAVVTSADADHLDIYGNIDKLRKSFGEFTSHLKKGGTLILKKGVNIQPENADNYTIHTYHSEEDADFYPDKVRLENDRFVFDLVTPARTIPDITLGLPGKFNLENAIAACAVACVIGIPDEVIARSLATFKGVERRFDFQVIREDFIYIDDYAHHPEELKACIRAVRELYPSKKITGVFQPHLFTRTRDFADAFARSLELLDELILLEIYPAREEPIPGIDSAMLLGKVNLKNKRICSKAGLLNQLRSEKPEVLLTLGAGDIDQMVKPIQKLFLMQE
jgi:UDP-N-acetylmuramate--alanine ligase